MLEFSELKLYLAIAALSVLSSCSPKLVYIPDGHIDYWQTPHETQVRSGGDCDDLAINYWWSHQSGWLVYGTADGEAHLWVKDDNDKIIFTSAPGRKHVIRFYWNKLCLHVAKKDSAVCLDAKIIKKWYSVLKRIDRENGTDEHTKSI